MSQDSCDDEDKHAALPPPTGETPGSQRTTNIRQDQREPSEPSCWRRPTTWNVVFNGILAITTALLGLIAYWQLNSSHLDQRAWVGIKEIRMVTFEADKPITVAVTMSNSGKTFAKQVGCLVHIVIARGVIDIGKMTSEMKVEQADRMVIFPNFDMTKTRPSSLPVPQDQFNRIRSRTSTVYAFGDFRYVDVFDKDHVTEFCGSYNPDKAIFELCDQHQSAT